MKPLKGYLIGAAIILIIGIVASLMTRKGDFLIWLAEHRNIVLDYYFYYITHAGEAFGFIVVGLVLVFSSWKKMILVPGVAIITTALTHWMKVYFQHERPSLFLQRMGWTGPTNVLDYHMLTGHSSFPSGHSMAAWALFTLGAALMRNTWASLLCLLLAVSVSLSRVYLMAHFLEDVVMGAVIGLFVGLGMYYGYTAWTGKKA